MNYLSAEHRGINPKDIGLTNSKEIEIKHEFGLKRLQFDSATFTPLNSLKGKWLKISAPFREGVNTDFHYLPRFTFLDRTQTFKIIFTSRFYDLIKFKRFKKTK